ncbi:MAG: hypothetical protein JNJ58_12850 [Chitinophagaceae bacterium]|nr:hypothetical protein [Chitinophagaceae bacterium]
MKKILFTLLTILPFLSYAQNKQNDSIKTENEILISKAGKDLARYEVQNIAGYLLSTAGTLLISAGVSKSAQQTNSAPNFGGNNSNKPNGISIVGGIFSLLGGGLILTSATNIGNAGRKLKKVKKVQ